MQRSVWDHSGDSEFLAKMALAHKQMFVPSWIGYLILNAFDAIFLHIIVCLV